MALSAPVELIIRDLVQKRFLTRQKRSLAALYREITALKPWIARRGGLPAFLIRRDPRDRSRIWVLEPDEKHYVEIPYRTLSHPAITLWGQRQALPRLRQLGREQVDEAALFRMVRRMRDIVDTAQHTTRKVRRDTERKQHLKTLSPSGKAAPPVAEIPDIKIEGQPPATPFEQIDEW